MSASRPVLTTAHLLLRPLVPADAEALAEVRYHPEVTRWLRAVPAEDPVGEQRRLIAEYEASWERHGYAPFAVIERASGRFAGYCGLRWLEDIERTDIVWTIDPGFQGKHYAPEAAAAALDWGFRVRKLPRIGAIIRPDNSRSQAVALRLGMRHVKDFTYRGEPRGWWETPTS